MKMTMILAGLLSLSLLAGCAIVPLEPYGGCNNHRGGYRYGAPYHGQPTYHGSGPYYRPYYGPGYWR